MKSLETYLSHVTQKDNAQVIDALLQKTMPR